MGPNGQRRVPATSDPVEGRLGPVVLSVAEAADVLGISDDLVYELVARRELPCLRFGRRRVIPRRAIDLVIERAMEGFDPGTIPVASPAADQVLDESSLPRRSAALRSAACWKCE
ncbi:MAG TPA: helix-turn-helix domain-containing protein [Acidimicrobiales bacterium]|jgi:excisionase family DNA binding protein|nr:helix-turn-helix domain-containing protein [Actinomycetota bacterium]HSH60096.1 helix-turn-helix domain-containing protein [Acidimicrobiales bacterium]